MKLSHVLIALVASSLAAPSLASADFGSQGTVAIQGLPRFQILRTTTTPPDGASSSETVVGIGAIGHYFAADHLSLGGGVLLAREWDDGDPSNMIQVHGLASYQFELRPRLHLWPQAMLSLARQSVDSSSNPTLTIVVLTAYVPAVYEVAEHFVIGWGPMVGTTLHASFERYGDSEDAGSSRVLGAQAIVGGWF